MKALRFLIPLLFAAISPAHPTYPAQRVIYAIGTPEGMFNLEFWWDVQNGALTTGYRNSPEISPAGDSFQIILNNRDITYRLFGAPNRNNPHHPVSARFGITGILIFTPPPGR